jgi:hypothetical protein
LSSSLAPVEGWDLKGQVLKVKLILLVVVIGSSCHSLQLCLIWTCGYHHDTKVKPEAATTVAELLMMGGRTPETCWAVNKCQDNKMKNCWIWLVIYLNCTMMHGLTNLKKCFYSFGLKPEARTK